MGYTIDLKNTQEVIKETIETNDKKVNGQMKNNSYENIKSIASEQNAFKHNNKNNNTIKIKIDIGI
jgi:hypothetical protein